MLLFLSGLAAMGQKKCVIGVNPFAPIGLTNVPRFEIFGELFFNKSSVSVDIGVGNFMGKYDSSVLANKGFRSALTYKNQGISKLIKNSLGIVNTSGYFYYGINLFYWYQQGNGFFNGKKSDSITQFNDLYGVKRNAFGANVILGYQTLLTRQISFDMYLGLGFKKLSIVNTQREYDPSRGDYSTLKDCGLYPCIGTLKEDSYSRINATMGVRVGYVINCRTKH